VDDYFYFSTRVSVGRCSHIASNCTIGGGSERLFQLGDFSSISAGCRIWCVSDNFSEDLVTVIPQGAKDVKKKLYSGDIIFGNYTACGANTVILPNNHIPEGTVIGALSFVPYEFKFEAWSVYAGNPIRLIKRRNREEVLSQVEKLEIQLKPT
jgi:acetyltransferase-like isoleucine patch superfamily enzyme